MIALLSVHASAVHEEWSYIPAFLSKAHANLLFSHATLLTQVHEEEWSYIPVGGPLPLGDQPITAFGAAANLVHPATGESVREVMCWI